MNRRRQSGLWWIAALALLAGGVWGQHYAQSAAPTQPVQQKVVALRPTSLPVSTADLTGRLDGMTVVTRVDAKSGKSVASPDLRATLILRNTTADQAIRLLSGEVEYMGTGGAVIPLAKDQGSSGFSFFPDQSDGLVPGQQTSQVIRVPFPVAAIKANTLHDIRLHLTYRATPYKRETVDGRVTFPG